MQTSRSRNGETVELKPQTQYSIDIAYYYPSRVKGRLYRKIGKTINHIVNKLLPYPNIKLVLRNVYFEVREVNSAFTDGSSIVLNPRIVLGYDLTSLSEIVIHEFLHIVLGHPIRARRYTSRILYNFAADIMVDSIASKYIYGRMVHHLKVLEKLLIEGLKKEGMDGKADMIKDLIEDVASDPSVWSTEKIYDYLLKIFDEKGLLEKIARMIEKMMAKAFPEIHPWVKGRPYMYGDMYGLFTLILKYRVLETIINKSGGPDWVSILRKLLVVKKGRGPYTSWKRPNKKLLVHGAYYPVKTSIMLNRLVLAVDVSGSIRDEDYRKIAYEAARLINSIGVYELYIIQFDADIVHVSRHVQPGLWDIVKAMEVRHGIGGTRFVPVFDYVEKEIGEVDAIIFFTDGEGEYPPYTPGHRTVWVLINNNVNPPFGEVVYA